MAKLDKIEDLHAISRIRWAKALTYATILGR